MTTSAQTILDELLEQEKDATAPEMNPSAFFEIFTAEQILKNYGLSYDEIQTGIVGQGGDGGIDAIYVFVNGVLATEDADYSGIKQNALITLVIIQSKIKAGFSEDVILKLESTIKDLLDISHKIQDYNRIYNLKLLRIIDIFFKAYRALISTSPELEIIFYYATKGDQVHPNVKYKVEKLKKVAKQLFSECRPNFNFIGAEQLLTLRRKSKIETLPLNVSEALPTLSMGTICLVYLKDFYNFIHDPESGELRGWLFEENVRDYEGKNVEVNKSIRQTLEQRIEIQDFWWLNNGITIVAAKAPLSGKTLSITDPKIVNGLQTSMEIFNFFRRRVESEDNRSILVRAIVTNDERTRNDIIKATNSQSAIKPASLRAFDPIHYKIEQYFEVNGLYYDRRKNYHKNQGKPKDKIISIQYLSQAIAAILLQRPNDSRGRPINLIKNQTLYNRIFNEKYPIEVYLECTRFMKDVDNFLVSENAPEYVRGHEVNVRYQLAMFASTMKARRLHVTPRYVQTRGLGNIKVEFLSKCLKHVWETLQTERGANKDKDEDRVAKSPDFDEALKKHIRSILKEKSATL